MYPEDYTLKERERESTVSKAVQAADHILMEETDGTTETLLWLTAEVARRFAERTSEMARTEIHKKEMQEKFQKIPQ